MTQQLLQPDTGLRLPPSVRLALIDMGVACNDAASAVGQAFTHQVGRVSALEAQHACEQAPGWRTTVTEELMRLADRCHAQAVAVFARVATAYAVYAAQVAGDIVAQRTPSIPGSQVIRPSDLLTALDLYVPNVHFTTEHGDRELISEQNNEVTRARKSLVDLITYQLKGEQVTCYDDPAGISPTRSESHDLLVGFPDALHAYAATLVWAVSMLTGVADDTDAGPSERG